MHYYALVCWMAISYAQMYVTSLRLLLLLSRIFGFTSNIMFRSIDWYLCAENFMHVDYDRILRDSKLSTCKFYSFTEHWYLEPTKTLYHSSFPYYIQPNGVLLDKEIWLWTSECGKNIAWGGFVSICMGWTCLRFF